MSKKPTDPSETILAEIATAKAALLRASKLLERTRPQPSLLAVKSNGNGHANEFLIFYTIYPRHVGKADALKAYEKARKRTSAEVILDGAKRYAALRAGEDETRTAHPATWLNGSRWEDEPAKMDAPRTLSAELVEAQERARGMSRIDR